MLYNILHDVDFASKCAVNTRGHKYKLTIVKCNKLVLSMFFIRRIIHV